MKQSFKEYIIEKEEEAIEVEAQDVLQSIKDFLVADAESNPTVDEIHKFAKDDLNLEPNEVEDIIIQMVRDYISNDVVDDIVDTEIDDEGDAEYDETVDADIVVDEIDADVEPSFNKGNPKRAEIIKATFDGKDFPSEGKSTITLLSNAENKGIKTVVLTKINRNGDTVLSRYDWDEQSDDFITSNRPI